MDILKSLNPAQREAVEINDKNLLIIAGAGSGKTRVLTHKIAYLLNEKGIKPSQILAMTFSNRAAKEMKERLINLLPGAAVPYWVGTFHSVCVKLLREFISRTKLKDNFTIYDEDDQTVLVKESLSRLNLDDKKYKPRGLVELFSRYKNTGTDESRYFEHEHDRINLGNIFSIYQGLLESANALDFGGILIEALRLFEDQEVSQIIRSRWKYILIDEYQDTNGIQRMLLRALKGDSNFVCAVGDDDQSIYMWRGATIDNILSFPKDFPGSVTVKLEKNYRSTKKILDAANRLIMNNARRTGKSLFTDNPQGEPIDYYKASDEKDEAAYIAGIIERMFIGKGSDLSDMAVFYRTHAQSRAIEEALVAKRIPYKIVGGAKFYERKEIKDMLAYLKFLSNRDDSVALKRILNVPTRGIGRKSIEILEAEAARRKVSPWEIIRRKIPFGGKTHLKFCEFERVISTLDSLNKGSVHDLAICVFQHSGYEKSLLAENSYEGEARLDNVKELLSSIKDFENIRQGALLRDYLETISLVSETDQYESNKGRVTLMTVHCAKGLEFDTVFVAGLEDGLFPHQNSLDDYSRLEEERRLLYVAITRAMKKLYLTNAFMRRFFSTNSYKSPSRFIDEIKESLTEHSRAGLTGQAPRIFLKKEDPSYFYDYIPDYDDSHELYKRGAKVRHPEFGDGVIKKCEKSGSHFRLTINFKLFGIKKIVPDYIDLEILSN